MVKGYSLILTAVGCRKNKEEQTAGNAAGSHVDCPHRSLYVWVSCVMGMVLTKISVTILGVTKCAMNYESYIPKLVQGKGVGLVNWPEGVEFKRMSLQ